MLVKIDRQVSVSPFIHSTGNFKLFLVERHLATYFVFLLFHRLISRASEYRNKPILVAIASLSGVKVLGEPLAPTQQYNLRLSSLENI